MVYMNLLLIKEYKYTPTYSCCAYEWAVGKKYFCLHFYKLKVEFALWDSKKAAYRIIDC
jgi:hypothetical protein